MDDEIIAAALRDVLFVMATELEYGERLRRRIRPLVTGVGPIEAAIGVSLELERRRCAGRPPRAIVSLGSAGSCCRPLGSIHQVASVSWRDMDASPLGFPRGVTPFSGLPATIALPTPFKDLPAAMLSTGADVVTGRGYDRIDADLVDMETYAVARAAAGFGVPVIGLRGVSDGEGELTDLGGWTGLLGRIDAGLAAALDDLPAALDRLPA